MKKIFFYLLLIVAGSITLSWLAANEPDIETAPKVIVSEEKAAPKPLTRDQRIDKEFNYDGSFTPLVVEVIKSLKDPDSFEHIETKVMDREDNLFITMKYRARNSLGGMVVEQASAIYWPDKNQFEII